MLCTLNRRPAQCQLFVPRTTPVPNVSPHVTQFPPLKSQKKFFLSSLPSCRREQAEGKGQSCSWHWLKSAEALPQRSSWQEDRLLLAQQVCPAPSVMLLLIYTIVRAGKTGPQKLKKCLMKSSWICNIICTRGCDLLQMLVPF